MKNKPVFLLVFTCFWFAWNATLLAQRLNATKVFVKTDNLKHAGIGIKVVDLGTGNTVESYNENWSLVPASVLKLVTTASVLEMLGEGYLYRTELMTDGIIDAKGVLQGSLYIKGSGDPTLGSEFLYDDKGGFLKEWTAIIKKAGIKYISGNIVALDDLFGYEGVSPQWTWEDIGNYYAAGAYGISIFDNTYRLYLKSGTSGTQPSVLRMEPVIPSLKFENQLKAAANKIDSAYIYGMPFSLERRIYGTIPQNSSSFVIKGDIPDPGLTLASVLAEYLQKEGVTVYGESMTYRVSKQKPTSKKRLAITYSKPMADLIRIIHVRSNNHYAEHLYRTIRHSEGVSIPDFWKQKEIETDGLFMQDGCGLSPTNAVSAGMVTDLLVYMKKKSNSSEIFYHSLPIAGKEGTVVSFLQNTPLAGKVRVKSGSMRDVQSYAGYVDIGNRSYAFTIIVNHYTGKRSVLKWQIEQLLTAIF